MAARPGGLNAQPAASKRATGCAARGRYDFNLGDMDTPGTSSLTIQLECECGTITNTLVVGLRRGENAHVNCRRCNHELAIECLVTRTPTVQLDAPKPSVRLVSSTELPDDDDEPTIQ